MFNGKSKIDLIVDFCLLVVVFIVYMFLMFLLITVVIGYESVGKIFYDYGSFMAGLMALLAAWMTIRGQKKQLAREVMERRRLESIEALIQLKALFHNLSDMSFGEGYTEISEKMMSSVHQELVKGEQYALGVEVYLINNKRRNELKRCLLRIRITLKSIDLLSHYLRHFSALKKHPHFKESPAWKWRVADVNGYMCEVEGLSLQAGYGGFSRIKGTPGDFTLSHYPGDVAMLNNLCFFVGSRVLQDLIKTIRYIDEIKSN